MSLGTIIFHFQTAEKLKENKSKTTKPEISKSKDSFKLFFKLGLFLRIQNYFSFQSHTYFSLKEKIR